MNSLSINPTPDFDHRDRELDLFHSSDASALASRLEPSDTFPPTQSLRHSPSDTVLPMVDYCDPCNYDEYDLHA